LAQYHFANHSHREIGVDVKRWVLLDENNHLQMWTTGGHEPVGTICEARGEWVLDEISYDPVSKVVFIDPAKVRIKKDAELAQKWEEKKRKSIAETKQQIKWLLKMARPFSLGVAIGILLGKFLL
jgi:hypothetical protein